jgi:hypothetical protein
MSSDHGRGTDFDRQIILVEAMLNADREAPYATRLGSRVTARNNAGKEVVLEIEGGRLTVWMPKQNAPSFIVTDYSVPEIVELIERLIADESPGQ